MVDEARSWLKDNQTLALFLLAQLIGLGAAASAILAYSVRLETRVHIMETRGAEYTVARMEEMKLKINALEQQIKTNQATIEKLVVQFLRDREHK